MSRSCLFVALLVGIALTTGISVTALGDDAAADSDDAHALALPEEPTELAELPARPRPIIDLGNRYLANEEISPGFTLPTGAVWQPSLLAWGALRSALQAETGRAVDQAQWANRLDLFGQLSLTATERFVIGLEPLQKRSRFSGYRFGVDGADAEIVGDVEAGIQTLFFEGDIGELFPRLDRDAWWPIDLGFSVGRMPVVYQDGFLLDDRLVGFGLVQNSILARHTSNLRVSVIGAWDGVNRGDNTQGGDAGLAGLSTEFDLYQATWAFDAVYVDGERRTNGAVAGISMIRRIHDRWNLTTRALGSYATQRESPQLDRGLLGVVGVSVAPYRTHDLVYFNVAASYRNYTAAARSADRGGPLGRLGILFEAPGLGSIGSPLRNDTNRLLAGALGVQHFFSHRRGQIVFELAGRSRHDEFRERTIAVGVRFQHAVGRHVIVRVDGYAGDDREDDNFAGGRTELILKF